MPDDIAIKVDNIHKTFKLPHEKTSTVKSAIINFTRHKKGYETQQVLKGVSIEIKKGDFFGIVGRNGSGKSTLLKLLAGIYTPDFGDITVNGRLTPFIELGVGFNPELSGRENVYLNGALLGFNRKEIDAMYRDIVEFAELERFMDQKLKNYSSGMQVRLAFSIAIRARTEILLLDEVLAVGDEAFQRKCYDYFDSLKRNKKTVIIVTHDMSAVERFCNRAILIEAGNVVREGDPRLIAQSYKELFEPNAEQVSEEVIEANNEQEEVRRRWGSNELVIDKVKASIEGTKINISFGVKCNVPVNEKVAVAYTVKSSDGASLFGDGFEADFKKTKEGVIIPLSISFNNILSKDKYYLDLSIRKHSTGIYCDFWTDCIVFRVKDAATNALHILTDSKLTQST